jgi:hypothetical protein
VTIALGDPALTLRVAAARAASIDPLAIATALRGFSRDESAARRIRIDEVWAGFALWLALRDDGCCRLTAYGPAADSGIVPNLVPGGEPSYGTSTTLGTCRDGELIVFTPRASADVALRRYGVAAGGIERMQASIASWDAAGRPGNDRLHVTVGLDGVTAIGYRDTP